MTSARIGPVSAMLVALLLTCLPAFAAAKKKPPAKSATPATKPGTETGAQPAAPAAAAANVIKLPAPADAIVPGGGGQFLILHLKKLQQLAIFDVSQLKVVKYLPIPTNDIVFTAGAKKLFIGLKDLKQIQRWDLTTLEREVTVPAPEGGISAIAMGANATTPLLVISERSAKLFWTIDPTTMQSQVFPSHHWAGRGGGAWGPTHVFVSFDGSACVACGGGWAGIELGAIVAGKVIHVDAGGYVNGGVAISGNGHLVFPDGGGIIRSDLTSKVTGIEGTPFPAVDQAFSLAFQHDDRKPSLTIFSNSDPRPLITVRNVPELAKESKMPLWQRVQLIPRYKSLITLGDGGDQLLVRAFDMEAQLAAQGIDFLFVESAPPTTAAREVPYTYDMKIRSKKGGVKTELQAGPPGMTLSADGKLQWKIPASFTDPTAAVIIQVSDATGQTAFHTFVVKVSAGPAVAAAPTPATPGVKPGRNNPVRPEKPTTPQVTSKPPEKPNPATAKPAAPTPGPVAVTPEAAPGGALVIPLAEPFGEYHAANGGKTLVFYQPKAKELVVFETATGKSQGVIRLGADNVRFACGSDVIVVALPDQRIVQSYSLKTLQRVKSAPFPNTKPLKHIRMGNASAGPLFFYFAGEMAVVDVPTLMPMKLRGKLPAGPPDWRFDFRVSADGSTIVSWDSYASPSIFNITRVKNGTATTIESQEWFSMANRRFTPTADGSLVLYETKVFNAAAKAVDADLKGYHNCIPTSDPRFIIAVKEAKGHRSDLAICAAADRRVLTELKGVSDVGNTGGYDGGRCGVLFDMPGAGEPRVVYLPDLKMLALIPLNNDHFQLIKLDLNAVVSGAPAAGGAAEGGTLAVVSLPPREVAVGETLNYQVQVLPEKAKVQYKVESGPKGLTVSPAGVVSWKVTERPIGGKANVILSVSDASGRDIPHAFEIAVVRNAVAPAAPGAPAAGQAGAIVKADAQRVELPSGLARFVPGMSGRALVLSGDQFAVLGADGYTILESRVLPKSYTAIAERKDYFVALCKEPRSIDLLNKKTMEVIKTRPIAFEAMHDLVLHPTRPLSYVSYMQPGQAPRHRYLIFDETNAEARTDDNWIGQWLAIAPDGAFLMAGFQETYQKGHDIIDNPDRIWIVPTYGSFDSMARYDLDNAGMPVRVSHRDGVGGNGAGIRLSADGKRASYLSHGGYPSGSANIGGWDPKDLKKLPVAYLTKDIGTPKAVAYHPLLPLVASPGKGSVVFFDRETGERQLTRINDEQIAGEDIQQVYFSPDGKNLILLTMVQSVPYLYRLPLKLSDSETKAVTAGLPLPDKKLDANAPAPRPPTTPRKLPQARADIEMQKAA